MVGRPPRAGPTLPPPALSGGPAPSVTDPTAERRRPSNYQRLNLETGQWGSSARTHWRGLPLAGRARGSPHVTGSRSAVAPPATVVVAPPVAVVVPVSVLVTPTQESCFHGFPSLLGEVTLSAFPRLPRYSADCPTGGIPRLLSAHSGHSQRTFRCPLEPDGFRPRRSLDVMVIYRSHAHWTRSPTTIDPATGGEVSNRHPRGRYCCTAPRRERQSTPELGHPQHSGRACAGYPLCCAPVMASAAGWSFRLVVR